MRWRLVWTEWGWSSLAATEAGLRASTLPQPDPQQARAALARALAFWRADPEGEPSPALAPEWTQALQAYFAGEPVDFQAAPVDWNGATEFQQRVWTACRAVPFGHTCSYSELAAAAGRPGAARAVGQAVGVNPLPLIVPCHRVIGARGGLVGFGSGLAWKSRLLKWESRS